MERRFLMRAGLMAVVLIVASASLILAKDPASYDKGLLLSMDSSACGTTEKGARTVKGKVLGTDGEHESTEEVLCQEYVL
jgi:hypothetical protein